MNSQISSSQNSFHQAVGSEQLDQVIKAITDGRYSWACVLILRFVDYNPLHFIPQRTYSRLIKENSQVTTSPESTKNQIEVSVQSSVINPMNHKSSKVLSKIN